MTLFLYIILTQNDTTATERNERRQNEMKILGFDFNTYLKFENTGNMEILGFDFNTWNTGNMEIFEITLQNRQTEIGFNTSLNFITTIHWILLLLLLLYAIPDVFIKNQCGLWYGSQYYYTWGSRLHVLWRRVKIGALWELLMMLLACLNSLTTLTLFYAWIATLQKYKYKGSEYKYRRSFHTLHLTYIHEARRIPRPFDVLGGIKFQN